MPIFKALVIVLAIGAFVFWWLKPVLLQFTPAADFARRRNLWLFLTCLGFLSPNIWLYIVVATPLLLWAGRRDSNPIALYLVLLHVIPPLSFQIPFPGITYLFEISNYRLLALCILIPTIGRLRADKSSQQVRGLQGADLLLLLFGMMQVLLFVRPDTPTAFLLHDSTTNMLRRAVLFMLDIYVLYFAVSRTCDSRKKIVDAMAAFCMICCVMALQAVFETLRNWLLYHDMALQLNPGDVGMRLAYLLRGGALRAQVAAGHALSLGYLLAVAFGFWLYLRPHVESRVKGMAVPVVLWAGLFAAYSRGPWMGAAAIYFVTVVLNPQAFGRLARATAVVTVLAGFIALTPLGDRIMKVLPFIGGSVDAANLDYRHRLADASWDLIVKHPFFGDQDFISKMQQLRQGQGIIDIVNTYAGTALEYGLVGLGVFVGFMLLCAIKGYGFMRAVRGYDADLARLGSCMLACIAGTMLMIYNSSLVFGYEKMFYVLAGLTTAYFRYCAPPEMSGGKDSKRQGVADEALPPDAATAVS